jgi:hypothetical protein
LILRGNWSDRGKQQQASRKCQHHMDKIIRMCSQGYDLPFEKHISLSEKADKEQKSLC